MASINVAASLSGLCLAVGAICRSVMIWAGPGYIEGPCEADVNLSAEDRSTPLVRAALWRQASVVQVLIEHHSNVNVMFDGSLADARLSGRIQTDHDHPNVVRKRC